MKKSGARRRSRSGATRSNTCALRADLSATSGSAQAALIACREPQRCVEIEPITIERRTG